MGQVMQSQTLLSRTCAPTLPATQESETLPAAQKHLTDCVLTPQRLVCVCVDVCVGVCRWVEDAERYLKTREPDGIRIRFLTTLAQIHLEEGTSDYSPDGCRLPVCIHNPNKIMKDKINFKLRQPCRPTTPASIDVSMCDRLNYFCCHELCWASSGLIRHILGT